MPTPANEVTSDEPPKLMKGSVMPVNGAVAVMTAMLMKACETSQQVMPKAKRPPK